MQNAMNLNDTVIVSIKGSDYRFCFWYMSKDDAINIMKNSNLNEKTRLLQFFPKHKRWMVKLHIIKVIQLLKLNLLILTKLLYQAK